MGTMKYWIGALLVVAAVGYLAITAADKNMVTYLTISDVMADPAVASDTGVRVTGHVAEGTIQVRGPREVAFIVEGDGHNLPAVYRGAVPDTFKDGAEVVLEGRMDANGEFQATTLLAKCPSKYEAEGYPDGTPYEKKDDGV